jgi:hypothetical protein
VQVILPVVFILMLAIMPGNSNAQVDCFTLDPGAALDNGVPPPAVSCGLCEPGAKQLPFG